MPNITDEPYLKRSRGGRISSPELRESLEQADNFEGLEENTNKYDLLLLVKRVGKASGFTPRMISLLDYYINFTRDIDWEEGAQPIVYQSLTKTAFDMGVSERQIQNLEKALFKIGAVTWNDSGNHRRYGHRCRETGAILYAYGINLAPLAAMKAELESKYHEKQLYEQAWMETKRQISWYRRQIRSILNEVGQGSMIHYSAINESFDAISGSIRSYMDLLSVRELLAKHKNLYQELLTLIQDEPQKTNKNTSTEEKNFVHYKNTNNKKSNKLDTSRATLNRFQKSCNENRKPESKPSQPTEQSRSEEGQGHLIEKSGLLHLTAKQLLNAASDRFRERIPMHSRAMSFDDIVEAAYLLRSDLHISQKSWARACEVLTRYGAAVCVLLLDQAMQREDNPVRKPAAYFNAMISKAGVGDLYLQRSVFGLLKREYGEDTANADTSRIDKQNG